MIDRRMFVLTTREKRHGLARIVAELPKWSRIEIKGPKRTLPQNDKMWAMLTEISEQAMWAGKKRSTADWKDLLTAAVKVAAGGVEVVPGLEGGIMVLGLHTSDLSASEMGDLISYMEAKGVELGVNFDDGEGADGVSSPVRTAA